MIMELMFFSEDYKEWLKELKARILSCQLKAAATVNTELLRLYWDIGRMIVEKQDVSKWGAKLIEQLASDLKIAFPDMKGFSRTNLYYIQKFYRFYNQRDIIVQQPVGQFEDLSIDIAPEIVGNNSQVTENKDIKLVQQLVGLIPWGHHIVIFQNIINPSEALFYLKETITNNWSRSVLQMQIESNLFARQGKAITNFNLTLPKPQSDLANQLLKDPYNFSFLTLESDVQELDLERQLVKNITRFLLELGKGFAYMGRQYPLQVGIKEYRLDLLFYHVRLKCYVVIELKAKEFEPEFIGKLNFYLSALDSQVKVPDDGPTIGMLLCKTKDNLSVEFALRDVNKPIGVSEFTFSELPKKIQRAMPTVEELERELFKDETNE